MACREIVVAPGSTFGDAAPINASGAPIPATERAKIESPVLVEVLDSARRNHYDERLVEAFVSVGVELWLLENTLDSTIVCVNKNEFRTLFGKDPPQNFTSIGRNDKQVELTPFFETLASLQNIQQGDDPAWEPEFAQQLPSILQCDFVTSLNSLEQTPIVNCAIPPLLPGAVARTRSCPSPPRSSQRSRQAPGL